MHVVDIEGGLRAYRLIVKVRTAFVGASLLIGTFDGNLSMAIFFYARHTRTHLHTQNVIILALFFSQSRKHGAVMSDILYP